MPSVRTPLSITALSLTSLQPFWNDDLSTIASDTTLVIPLSIFALPDDVPLPLSPDVALLIPYSTLYSFLKDAELYQQETKGENANSIMKQQPLGTRRKRRQMTPEEQLEDDDEALFVASEEKDEKKADEEDGTWGPKTQRYH